MEILGKMVSIGDEESKQIIERVVSEAERTRETMLAKLQTMAEAGDPRAAAMLTEHLRG